MRDENSMLAAEEAAVRHIQETIRNGLDERLIPLKVIAADAKVSYSTLISWFPVRDGKRDPGCLSVAALRRLIGAMPADLLSLLLPDGWLIVRVPEQLDHDEVSEAVQDYLREKERAHHPESEAGREIGPTEDNVLRGKFASVRAA